MQLIKLLSILLLFSACPASAGELAALNATNDDPLVVNMDNGTLAVQNVNGSFGVRIADTNSSNATNSTFMAFFDAPTNSSSETNVSDEKINVQTNASSSQKTATVESPEEEAAVSTAPSTPKTTPSIGVSTVPLSYLSQMRALIEARKLEVALAKEDQKLRELLTPDPALIMPRLAKKAAKKKKSRPAWPKIISIQGVDGRLSATLSSPAGVHTVTKGKNAGPGRVVSITPSKVLIRFDGKNVALKFKE